MSDARAQLLDRIEQLHLDDEHQQIIALIEAQNDFTGDYDLASLLARAYNNYAQPHMDTYHDLLRRAVDLLRGVETEGLSDPKWHYRIGYALYFLDREDEALIYLRQAQALDPTDTAVTDLIDSCHRSLTARTELVPVTTQSIADYFDDRGWNYNLDDNTLLTGFTEGVYRLRKETDTDDLSLWGALRTDAPMDLRPRLVETCNDWNNSTRWPKTHVVTLDDGTVRICAEQYLTTHFGMTRAQLSMAVARFIDTSEQFFSHIVERFPSLARSPRED